MTLPQAVEVAAAAVLAIFWFAGRRERGAIARAAEIVALMLGAWLSEEGCMRLYHAYAYSPGWSLFADRLPVAVAVIWPAVVLSAREVARLVGGGKRVALWTGAVVGFDACFIEPIATHAGLWTWHIPGLLAVPVIGPLGWGFYAFAATLFLERFPGVKSLWLVPVAPLLTHALLLASWWGGLRFTALALPSASAVPVGLAVGAAALALALRTRRRAPMRWREAAPRVAASLVFLGLLAARFDPTLAVWGSCFAVPYLLLLDWPGLAA